VTIAVTTPASGASPLQRLGQGFRIVGTISGPTAIDDVLHATLTDSFNGWIAAEGRFNLLGANSFDFGLDEPLAIGGGVADNRTVTLQLEALDNTLSVYDSVVYSGGYVHDPSSGILSAIYRTVYAAVHKVYQ